MNENPPGTGKLRRALTRFLLGLGALVTLVALAYTEENLRGRHAWLRHKAQSEAKGEKLSMAAIIPAPVPDELNFALTPLLKPVLEFTQGPSGTVWADTNGLAHLERVSAELVSKHQANRYLQLGSLEKGTFADLPACAAFYRGNTNYPQAPPSATAADAILTTLDKFKPELNELREAADSRRFSRFPIQYGYEPSWGILLPHLARVKALTRLAEVHALAELEAGQPAKAFADLRLGLRLSDSIRSEPLLIDHLVRVATLALDLQILREGLVRHAWSEAHLLEAQTNLAGIDLLSEWKLAMRGERALATAGLDYLRRQGWRSDPSAVLENENQNGRLAALFLLMPSGWYYQNMVTISELEQDYVAKVVDERARRVFPQRSQEQQGALTDLRPGPFTIFARLLVPAVQKATSKSARMQTFTDAAQVACALERFRLANGKLPDSLEPLVPRFISAIPGDLIDGKPLRYKPEPDGGYVLYSVGWNGTDDGGELAWGASGSIDITKGDWVWQIPASRE